MAKEEFHPSYLESEQKFRAKVAPLHQQEINLRKSIRRITAASDSERMDAYLEEYQKLEAAYEKAANEFIAQTSNERHDLEQELHAAPSPDHLVAASSLSREQRSELLGVALDTAQPHLAQAVAQVARHRGEIATFERWANDEPERKAALAKLRGMPDRERLITRTSAMRPPHADLAGLKSTAEDIRAAEEERTAEAVRRQRAFNLPDYGPRRQVGGRITGGEGAA